MSQPFLNWPSSSKDFNFTSSKGIKCCNGQIWVQFNYNNIPPACCTFSCWSQCFHRQADHWRGRIACLLKSIVSLSRHELHRRQSYTWVLVFFCTLWSKLPHPLKLDLQESLKDFSSQPYLVHQGVVLRCQSSFPPGQFVGHLPQNSLHRNMFEVGWLPLYTLYPLSIYVPSKLRPLCLICDNRTEDIRIK